MIKTGALRSGFFGKFKVMRECRSTIAVAFSAVLLRLPFGS